MYKGHNEVAEILTRDGSWVSNGRTYYNESSLHIATRCLNVEIAEVLLTRGGAVLIDATTIVSLVTIVVNNNFHLVKDTKINYSLQTDLGSSSTTFNYTPFVNYNYYYTIIE